MLFKFGGVETTYSKPIITHPKSKEEENTLQDLFDSLYDHGKGLVLSALKGVYVIENRILPELPSELKKLEK